MVTSFNNCNILKKCEGSFSSQLWVKDFQNVGLLLVDDEKSFLGLSFSSALYNTTLCLNNAL